MNITIVTNINASRQLVFDTVADIEQYAQAIPHIDSYEFLTSQKTGKGTKFKETRIMQGKSHVNILEITEYDAPRKVVMVADTNGTVWTTLFEFEEQEHGTLLTLSMDAKAYKWFPWLLNPLIKGMIANAIEEDMNLLKGYTENLQN